VCDILDYQYRQLYHPKVGDRIGTVDVIIHVRFQRCRWRWATWLQHDTSPGEKGSLVHASIAASRFTSIVKPRQLSQ